MIVLVLVGPLTTDLCALLGRSFSSPETYANDIFKIISLGLAVFSEIALSIQRTYPVLSL